MKNRSKIDQKSSKIASWGLLRASWKLDRTIIEKWSKFGSLPGRILGPCWPPKKNILCFFCSKRRPGRVREAIFEVSKNKLKIESSWDRFSIDFGRVLAPPGKDKMCAPLRREWNFGFFGSLKISWLLDRKKWRFLIDFGPQLGIRNRTCWLQEASWAEVTKKMGPKTMSKNKLKIEGSWDRFSIDFWRVLAPPGKDKMCAPLRRELNFGLFGSLKISWLLDRKKWRF